MPDAFLPGRDHGALPDWSRAFAQLPLASPPEEARARFVAALQRQAEQRAAPTRERRASWAVGLASAAVLALAVVAPVLLRDADRHVTVPPDAVAARPPASVATPPSAPPQDLPASIQKDAASPSELRLVQRALPGMERVYPDRSARIDRAQARAATDRLLSSLPIEQATVAGEAAAHAHALAQLQRQSRQLEALVALARDERMGHGAGVAITGELDAVLTDLDAHLQRPDLDPGQRVALWQQRVDTLEHLAGVATTQRWLASQGALDQVALVSVD